MSRTVTVVGAGSWGTTIAKLLTYNLNEVSLYCRSREQAEEINHSRLNSLYFPGVPLPSEITAHSSLADALYSSEVMYLAVPSRHLRDFAADNISVLESWAQKAAVLCSCVKGLLLDPTERIDSWLTGLFPNLAIVQLSGPNLAGEIMQGQPTAAVAAGAESAARTVQQQIMGPLYRVYTASDATGVEVAGFYKNIIAIAAGTITELGFGENTRAVLITRALAEMGRLVDYFGGERSVLYGLAGIGDLIATCSSSKSRNFQVGMRLARGETIGEILSSMQQTAEGVQACDALHRWPREHPQTLGGLEGASAWPDLPIAEQVYRLVHEAADPRAAIEALMSRPPKAELA